MATVPLSSWKQIPKEQNLKIYSPSENRFYMDDQPTGYDQTYRSRNQALAGAPNPKIYDPIPEIPPIAAWDHWSMKHVKPSGINQSSTFDAYRSGYYAEGERCEPVCIAKHKPMWSIVQENNQIPTWKENYEKSEEDDNLMSIYDGCKMESGDVFDSCNYNSNQIQYNIPANVNTGKCELTDEMKEYNNSIYTEIVQPGLYKKINIVEPVNSNIGISFQQQHLPTTKQDKQGTIIYTKQDPRSFIPPKQQQKVDAVQTIDNTYDPRSYGYGTSYRRYVDPMLGQGRYVYDDVDAIRKPNYIGRSNIDHNSWAQSYGVVRSDVLANNRELAEKQFIDDTVKMREELQVGFRTRKGKWQTRVAPIHTMNMSTNTCRR